VVLQVDEIDGDDNKLTQDENGKLAVWTDNLLPHPDDAANSILKTDANDDLVAYATDAISGDADNVLTAGTDGKLFVPAPTGGGTVEVDPNSYLEFNSQGQLTVNETKLDNRLVEYKPINLKAFGETKFKAGQWVKVDEHLQLYITKDLEKFNLKYVRFNNSYPSSVNMDYDILCKFGGGKQKRHQTLGVFGNALGVPLGDGNYDQNYFYYGGDTFIFNNNVEFQETNDNMHCFVKLKSGSKIKNYEFKVKVRRSGNGDTKDKFLLHSVSVDGMSLSTDKASYND
jgi:hypothetical protein